MKTVNCSFEEFNKYVSDKRLVAFGGGAFLQVISLNYEELGLVNKIDYITDNDPDKDGTTYELHGRMISVYSLRHLLEDDLDDVVILISSLDYALDIYNQLDEISKLQDVPCLCLPLLIAFRDDEPRSGLLHQVDTKIPKIIHCFWFSGSEKDDMAKKCINSWRKYCPDYEIKEWNADNYDLTKNKYMFDAYKAKKWAYATDYARLDTVYEYGGFYFDLDLELIKNIEDLRHADFVAGFGPIRDIELAAFGAKKNSSLLGDILESYEDREFDPSTLSLTEVQPVYMDAFMRNKGFVINGAYQNVDGNILLHRDAFSPRNWFTGELSISEYSYGIHHCAGSWISKKNNTDDKYDKMKKLFHIFGEGDC